MADLAALKTGLMTHSPTALAVLFSLAILGLVLRFGALLACFASGKLGRMTAAAELLAVGGTLLALGAGTANWLLSLQGYAILHEGESVRLREGAQLQGFEAGPLARLEEMEVVVTLDELDLVPAGGDRFDPASRIRVWRSHDAFDQIEVSPRQPGVSGPLRFHQGAFGFAPRISIFQQEEGETAREVFDRVVPFITERHGPDGLSFAGEFSIADEDLSVSGRVDLESLDEAMRGHATLWLTLNQSEVELGEGGLLPGKFAEVDRGYRIGFTDLQRWSEIVISRRNYGKVMIVGVGIAIVGGLLRLLVWWRER